MSRRARIFFVEMMGEPGSFDASVYDHLEAKEDEGLWFRNNFAHVPGISIATRNPCIGEALPTLAEIDGLVLAGSYNSVHDNTDWQRRVRTWLPRMRAQRVPILAICGSHQLLAQMAGAGVEKLADGPFAGTFPLLLTAAGRKSPLLRGIADQDCFHYANGEHVAALDYGDCCFSTQFHPEGTEQTLGPIWQHKAPQLMHNYHPRDKGNLLVENFLRLVVEQLQQSRAG
jgi:GMP synthase-like glutamine amidotransferase